MLIVTWRRVLAALAVVSTIIVLAAVCGVVIDRPWSLVLAFLTGQAGGIAIFLILLRR